MVDLLLRPCTIECRLLALNGKERKPGDTIEFFWVKVVCGANANVSDTVDKAMKVDITMAANLIVSTFLALLFLFLGVRKSNKSTSLTHMYRYYST